MSRSYNRIIVVGNLTRGFDLKYTTGGKEVADIAMAINNRVKKDGEYVDEVCYLDVAVFGRMAIAAKEYLTKGSKVLFEGKLRMEQWEDKDGNRRTKHKMMADNMIFLDRHKDEIKADRGEQSQSTEVADEISEDIPF